jgi:hypothetical protein
MEGNPLLVRIMHETVNAFGVEGRRTALYAVDHISLRQEQFGEICTVLSGRAGNEGDLS